MEKTFIINEALTYIIGKALPCVLNQEELFRPKTGSLYVCESSSIYYLYFTKYNEDKLVGWLFDTEHQSAEPAIVIQSGAECWFGSAAGEFVVNTAASRSTIVITDAPEHQHSCIKPSDMLDAIKGGKLVLAS